MPLWSQADSYNVYQVTAKEANTVYVSEIARTEQMADNVMVKQSGGFTQSLIPDIGNTDKWRLNTSPIGTITNRGSLEWLKQ